MGIGAIGEQSIGQASSQSIRGGVATAAGLSLTGLRLRGERSSGLSFMSFRSARTAIIDYFSDSYLSHMYWSLCQFMAG